MSFENTFYVGCCGSALLLVGVAAYAGQRLNGDVRAILMDARGRFSLNHLQTVLWTWLVGSTLLGLVASAIFFGFVSPDVNAEIAKVLSEIVALEKVEGRSDEQEKSLATLKSELAVLNEAAKRNPFAIPPVLLGLMGIVGVSTVTSGAVKAGKDTRMRGMIDGDPARNFGMSLQRAATSNPEAYTPTLMQIITEDEGADASQIISVTKFQSLIFTLAIAVAYVVMTFKTATYPNFDSQLVYLIGISHAGYVGGKLPDKK